MVIGFVRVNRNVDAYAPAIPIPFTAADTTVRPNPATVPYTASAVAAPRPETRPTARPSARVRLMQSTPIGPTGAAIEKPTMIPLRRNAAPIGCQFVAAEPPPCLQADASLPTGRSSSPPPECRTEITNIRHDESNILAHST